MKRFALLFALSITGFAQIAPVVADTPSLFHAECTVSLLGHATFQSLCISEALSAQGESPRYRLVIANGEGSLPVARVADYVSTSATANGRMRVAAVLVGFVDVRPVDKAICFAMTSVAPAYEVRAQNMTLAYLPGGALELLIDESWSDSNGKEPSADWLARNREAHLLRSHSH
jgi:hypothetical protein